MDSLVRTFLDISKLDKNLSDRTLKAYNSDLILFSRFFPDRNLAKLGSDELRKYIAFLKEKKLADKTIRRKLATIKVFYSTLEDEGIIKYSPAHKLKYKFIVNKTIPRIISSFEISLILGATYKELKDSPNTFSLGQLIKYRNIVIFEILFSLGLRIDELVKLDLGDFNYHDKTVIIKGKGRKERLLFISSEEVLKVIYNYLRIRNRYAINTEAVLINKFGRRLSVHSIGNIFNGLLKKANIKRNYTPHCLRHTMATMLIENGADVRSVQEILGHSSIGTTEIYLTVSKKRKQEVLTKYGQRNKLHSFATGL